MRRQKPLVTEETIHRQIFYTEAMLDMQVPGNLTLSEHLGEMAWANFRDEHPNEAALYIDHWYVLNEDIDDQSVTIYLGITLANGQPLEARVE